MESADLIACLSHMVTFTAREVQPMSSRHPAIVHWSEIEEREPWIYPAHDEPMARGANYGWHFGFGKLGIHNERLEPSRRTSFPHAESAEEEFVYVIEGRRTSASTATSTAWR